MTSTPPKHAITKRFAGLRLWRKRINRRRGLIAAVVIIPLVILIGTAAGFYRHFAKITDEEIRTGAFRRSVDLYATPMIVSEGDVYSSAELAEALKQSGLVESEQSLPGNFRVRHGSFEINPKDQNASKIVSVSLTESSSKDKKEPRVSRITVGGTPVKEWSAGSPMIASLTPSRGTGDRGKSEREKRHPVVFAEIPPVLVNAVVSAEDKHFFQHQGVDVPRVIKASFVDLREGRKEQGGSTLTMQLVRGLWLQPEKKWKRKVAEILMTIRLERRWTKQQIFEAYANQVFLGRQDAYDIHGFAEGSRMLFGKSLRDLTLPEAALLAGMVQRPSYFNPYRHPDRARERRDLVLSLMKANRYIDDAAYASAIDSPIDLMKAEDHDDSLGAPYFLDLLDDELQDIERPENGTRQVETTLDLNLQRAATEAIQAGMAEVDKQLAKKYPKGPKAEAALIALDPHTGEIKAIVGGRNYSQSQLNRILAKRPPGSVFKPFVYAAALNSGIDGSQRLLTPSSLVDDSPDTFWSGGKPYRPANFHHESFGVMTLKQALAHSDNIAAVKVAQQIGFGSVVAMAKRAGLNDDIRPTPAVALGSYDVTPLEMAGAWTMFANGGSVVKPRLINDAKDSDGDSVYSAPRGSRQALDPRVTWLMVNMLQEVMRSGTAAGVRSRGFVLPAAGKTGTSHDGWFAGFTSQLLCLVWVGFDDYRELDLEGAKSALPIWTEFMKKAAHFAPYRNAVDFAKPSGITSATICRESGKLAGDSCLETSTDFFISGTEPQEICHDHDVPVVTTATDVQSGAPSVPAPSPD